MRIERQALPGATPGLGYEVAFLHFGQEGARPKTYIQAGLHADESPGHLAAHHVRLELEALEAEGLVRGHIVLAPAANPIGLAQQVLGTLHGRFALADGVNFNRDFPELGPKAAEALDGRLTQDAGRNAALVRSALLQACASWPTRRPAEHLKKLLLAQAIDADLVLDLHCDGEAVMHLYTLTEQAEAFAPLSAFLGAKAVLVAEISGHNPFDEAVSRPWQHVRQRFPGHPVPEGAIAATVELRGEGDVSHAFAAQDAEAILNFLALRGSLAIAAPPIPEPGCAATPLAGSEALEAPASGIIVYRAEIGAAVQSGDVIAEIVDPVSGTSTPVNATTSGIFYARTSARFAVAGRRLGKIAGATPFRNGDLLSP